MKAKKLAGLILALFVISGFVFAEAEKVKKAEKMEKTEAQQLDPKTRSMPRRGSRPDRSQMLRERMEKQMKVHKAALKELEDIKKIAEEEGATKTAEALQKLIDKKDAQFKKNLQKFEKARKERALKLQERTKKDKPEIEKPAKKVKEAVEEKAEEK